MTQNPMTFQSLCENVWVFSALMSLAESGGLSLLQNQTDLDALAKHTTISAPLIERLLEVLINAGFVVQKESRYGLSEELASLMKKLGPAGSLAEFRTLFGQTSELIRASREHRLLPGWRHADELTLQAQGKRSEIVVHSFFSKFEQVHPCLNKPGAKVLDVGAGVGAISLKLAELYPKLQVVALEPADIPYSLARNNIELAQLAKRIELRKMTAEEMQDQQAFDFVWFPQVFISDAVLMPALVAIERSLKTGGILFTSTMSSEDKGQKASLLRLQNTLRGGGSRTPKAIVLALQSVGFTEITAAPDASGATSIIAIKSV